MKGNCASCKKKKIEVRRVTNFMICQRCWAGAPGKIRNEFPVFKLTFFQKITIGLTDRLKQMGRTRKRIMTTKQREASNKR
jgi:hypothetical protein